MSDNLEESEIIKKTINEKTISFSYNISKIGIKSRFINLEKNAVFDLIFYNENDEIKKTEILNLTQEEYNNWGTDDNYILNLISQKYDVVFQ